MKKLEKIKTWIGLFVNRPYIPEELQKAKGPLLLHISDTPQEIYSYILLLVELVNPSYIIHTGDLVDNIKLEICPQEIEGYRSSLKRFVSQLEGCSKASIYYVMGNHDKAEIVQGVSERGIVMVEGHIMIEGIQFYVNHYHLEEEVKSQYYLFGHSFKPSSYKIHQQIGLNGVEGINVIDLATQQIHRLPYPFGTNQFRKMEQRKIGL